MKVVFAIPGGSFSKKFLHSWTLLLFHCINKGYDIGFVQATSCNIYGVRNWAFLQGGKVIDLKKPLGGMKYDWIFCIDSDVVFTPAHFDKIMEHDVDIVGGWYTLENNNWTDTCFGWSTETTYSRGSTTKMDVLGTGLVEVDFIGFGFLKIRKGVLESLGFPWFEPVPVSRGMGFAEDDESFCMKAQNNGYKVFLDPTVRVGHEKMAVF